jgi:hypothetical protein
MISILKTQQLPEVLNQNFDVSRFKYYLPRSNSFLYWSSQNESGFKFRSCKFKIDEPCLQVKLRLRMQWPIMDHGINFYQNKCATKFYRKSALDKENQFADQRKVVFTWMVKLTTDFVL